MLTFTILACFVAVAHAGSGYYYGPGLSGELPSQQAPSPLAVDNRYDFRLQQNVQRVQHAPKKTLNVMFLMAPELTDGRNIEVKINNPEEETETVIYLLSKENDASELLEKIQELQQNVRVRPEVMIIKYRTEEELENAVKAVQDKYNDLDGPLPLANESDAPVIDYPGDENELLKR